MIQIPDDPIISCMERTGWPPWMRGDYQEEEPEEEAPDDQENVDEYDAL